MADRPRATAPAGPEPLTLDRLEAALAKLAENPSMGHRAPTLATLAVEVARIERLMPDGDSPGAKATDRAATGVGFGQAADAAHERFRGELGR